MKKLSDTYKKLGIDFAFPIVIEDANGNRTYFEDSEGLWLGTPRSATCEGKVVEVDGIKYKLKAL